jgi:serine/threonine protein kinase
MSSETVGTYAIVKRLAIGGMAEIFLAKQRAVGGFERLVVLKRILSDYAGDPTFVASFLNEARVAAQLNHPNIVQIIDFGVVQSTYFIAMEYLRGYDLATVLRAARDAKVLLPLDVALTVLRDVLSALEYAHNAVDVNGQPLGLVHRDVTPSNIFLTQSGPTKVVDFGIAKATQASEVAQGKTKTGSVKGKLGYISPEQLKGLPLTKSVDLFACAIVAYELLTLRNPFRGESEYATLANVMKGEVAPPQKLRPEISEALQQVVLRALSADPAARYASAGEMQAAFEAAAHASGILLSHSRTAELITKQTALLEAANDQIERSATSNPSTFLPVDATGVVALDVEAPRKKRLPLLLAGAMVLLILGVVATVFWQKQTPAPVVITTPLPVVASPPASQPTSQAVSQPAVPPVAPPVTTPVPVVAAPIAAPPPSKSKDPRKPPAKLATKAGPGKIKLSAPSGAMITIDGEALGRAPLPPLELPAGTHRVAVEDKGKTTTRTVTIRAGETTGVSF